MPVCTATILPAIPTTCISDVKAGTDVLVGNGGRDSFALSGPGQGLIYDISGRVGAIDAAATVGGAFYSTAGAGDDTVFASGYGRNTFAFGASSTFVAAFHGLNNDRGNTYFVQAGGITITIADYAPGGDQVALSASPGHPTLAGPIAFFNGTGTGRFGATYSEATLSNGTKIDFLNLDLSNTVRTIFT